MFRRFTNPKLAKLRRLPAFANLSRRRLADLSSALDIVELPAGTVLMRQGELGRDFFLIIHGSARVERDGEIVARLTDGAVVGELALVGAGQRTATVVAETDMTVASGTRPSFASLVAEYPEFGAQVRRAADARLVDAA